MKRRICYFCDQESDLKKDGLFLCHVCDKETGEPPGAFPLTKPTPKSDDSWFSGYCSTRRAGRVRGPSISGPQDDLLSGFVDLQGLA